MIGRGWSGAKPVDQERHLSPHPSPLPEEKEPLRQRLTESGAVGLKPPRKMFLPLPGGEGRGEGNGDVNQSLVPSIVSVDIFRPPTFNQTPEGGSRRGGGAAQRSGTRRAYFRRRQI